MKMVDTNTPESYSTKIILIATTQTDMTIFFHDFYFSSSKGRIISLGLHASADHQHFYKFTDGTRQLY